MKKYLIILALTFALPLIQSCNNFGKEKDYNGVQLYHTAAVTDAEADKLGNYLVSQKFADGTTKTVQITKSGNTYQFRFVLKDDASKNSSLGATLQSLAGFLSSDVFNGAPVEVHACDEYLHTKQVYKPIAASPKKIFNGVQLHHSEGITDAEVDSLGNYLVRSKFADGGAKTVQLTKSGSTFQFRFVIRPGYEKDSAFIQNCRIFAGQLSNDVFKRSPVEIQMCDDAMNTLATAQMDKTPVK